MDARLEPLSFDALPGFATDDHLAAFSAFRRSAEALVEARAAPRAGLAPSPGLRRAARDALGERIADGATARRFFESRFRPFRVAPGDGPPAFLTGYYEPQVAASRTQTPEFAWPILARPDDLVSFAPEDAPPGMPEGLAGAQRSPDGTLRPYPDRAAIEQARLQPVVWLRDSVEAFLIQVQGSATVVFCDGARARLAYDGRNGLPYASIGRLLIESGAIAETAMSLATLKRWLRTAGAGEGGAGLELMRRNRSFVFFKLVDAFDASLGPVAGAGVALTPLRSIAVDRTVWPYGTPVWIDADLPWRDEAASPFRRLTIAQDTGSAIVGAARADIFFGAGDEAGARAGAIRHASTFVVLLPRDETL